MKPKANIRNGMSIYAVGIALGVPTFSFRKVAIKNIIQLIENIEFLFTS